MLKVFNLNLIKIIFKLEGFEFFESINEWFNPFIYRTGYSSVKTANV